MIEISQQSGSQLNWIHYSEAIFPSARNQFVSSSRERLGYDNKFWRDSPNARVTLGSTFNNSFGMDVEQSSWALDPQEDFLTRTDVVSVSGSITIAGFKRPGFILNLQMEEKRANYKTIISYMLQVPTKNHS